jgi:hypothetical protein
MKKGVLTFLFGLTTAILLVSGLSCWSPFEPVANMGKDVITSVDPGVTDLKNGFRKIDSVFLAAQGARSLVCPGNDASKFMLKSGDFAGLYEAGRFGDDSAVMYAEFQMSSADLATYKTARNGSADSVKFLLWYDTSNNDRTIPDPLTIQVFLCARKVFPYVRNELATVDSALPCTTIVASYAKPDSFFISLGAEMVSRLNSAIADTASTRYISKIDSVSGTDTTGLPFLRFDTTFIYDTLKKFIGAVSVRVLGGDGIVRFARQPVFQISYHQNSTESVSTRNTYVGGYYDINVTEKTSIPGDSLVASWQADRFVEIPINLKSMWDSAKTSDGKDFKIVQDASCLLDSVNSFFEGMEKNDTARTIVFGLLDHTISDSKAHSMGTRDSLLKFSGLASKVISASQKQISLPLTMFLQSLSDRGRPETAYLYLFVEPATRFARVAFENKATIRFTALFSNSHK